MSHEGRILDGVTSSKRHARIKSSRRQQKQQAPIRRADPALRAPHQSQSQVLEQIEAAHRALEQAEAELETLIDHAVGLGISWPEIAAQLGVTRQAARQHYQRRHREDTHHVA